jgi:hypothetical protein
MPDVAERWHATRRELAGRAVAEVARTARDRWRPRRSAVPRTPTDITPDWLSALFGRPATVTSVEVADEFHGTATRARLALSGESVPASVFVKTTPTRVIERVFHNVYGLGETEAAFYQQIAQEIPDCTPAVYGARWDAGTGRSAVVIEDLAARPAGRVRFADAGVACTAEEAAVTARTLAGVQRRYWASPRFGSDLARFAPSGSPSMWFGTYSSALVARLPHRYDDIVDADFRADALLLHTRRDQVAALWRSLPQSLLHGDTHRGNIAFEDHGAAGPATSGPGAAGPATSGPGAAGPATAPLGVTLFDWQVAGQGPAYKDLAYFAATSLAPDVRRATERDLVADYVDVVRAGGGPDITEAAAWDAHRLLVVTAYTAAAFTAVFSGRLQSDETMRAALARAVAAVRDHDSFARLRAHLT